MILGLDVSTSITGIAISDEHGKIIHHDYIDTRNKRKYPDLFDVVIAIKEKLEDVKRDFNIHVVFIEESLQSFRSGFSSAKTLSTLSKINGIVSYLCLDIFAIKPEYLNSATARKNCGVKIKRGENAKEIVVKHLLDTVPGFVVEYTPSGNVRPFYFDMADAIIIAKGGLLQCERKQS